MGVETAEMRREQSERRRLGFEMRQEKRRLMTDDIWPFLEKRLERDRREELERRLREERRDGTSS